VIEQNDIRLAGIAHARAIALMSRHFIEDGLGWSWTTPRVAKAIRNPDCNVAVIESTPRLAAFGIMEYGLDTAHLLLFAVRPDARRRRLGSRLLTWLEETALVAGVQRIDLETRHNNLTGRRFYATRGYEEIEVVPGYYSGRESAVRMSRRLRAPPPWA
jgi:ribosomal-protein-alanine N-acetyltransferase